MAQVNITHFLSILGGCPAMVCVIRTQPLLITSLFNRLVGLHKISEWTISAKLVINKYELHNVKDDTPTCMRFTCSSCQVSIEIERTKLDRRQYEQQRQNCSISS